MKAILLLEDDENLNRGISLKLQKEGYQVFSAFSIKEAKEYFENKSIQMVICDITLPDGNGLDFGKWVREKSNSYLIYLTAMDQEIDIINGYDTGADDYMTKPFSVVILTSKVNALMRRLDGQDSECMRSGEFELSKKEMTMKKDGKLIPLSKTEIVLLLQLMENAGCIVTKDQILERVWGLDGQFVDENTVTVNISRLKTKLETNYISNVRGLGYLWTEKVITK